MNQFTLPELKYPYDAFEGDLDAETMEIHYSKHHQGYLDKLNTLCEEQGINTEDGIEAVVAAIDSESTPGLRNNAGGYYNHNLFWENLSPIETTFSERWAKILDAETSTNRQYFLDSLIDLGMSQFGSGWAWIVMREDGTTMGMTTPNQDNPLMKVIQDEWGHKYIPLLAIDLWEHAYYLKYQNRRKDYLAAVIKHIDWAVVEDRYFAALDAFGVECPIALDDEE